LAIFIDLPAPAASFISGFRESRGDNVAFWSRGHHHIRQFVSGGLVLTPIRQTKAEK
jgi:hypothetical protein